MDEMDNLQKRIEYRDRYDIQKINRELTASHQDKSGSTKTNEAV